MASVVDRAKEVSQDDLLKIQEYSNGLIRFIESSATPITIGVQGEWGSGKTSLLNTIRDELCEQPHSKQYAVWLNTWEYSLLSTPDETLIKIISGLVNQIGALTIDNTTENGKKAAKVATSLLKGFGGVVGGFAGKSMTMVADGIDSTLNKPEDNSIKALRTALQKVIDEALSMSDKRAFIFFIDDLDRLDPTVAVSILELIKNLFDLKNCIFVLAIDYNVVVKGLESKFGKLTAQNEWEFRAFFDKIIQLPFSMPMSNYDISNYLKSLLVEVNYFKKEDLENEQTIDKVTEIVSLSVGANPRALKRLANSVSLIEIIRADKQIPSDERVIEFALICMQIAYPLIYSLVQKEPDFTSWDNQMVYSILKDNKVNTDDLELLKDRDEFDELWEQNLWKIAQVNSFLKERVLQISLLLNFIRDNIRISKNEDMNEAIARILRASSVTSVNSGLIQTEKKKYTKVKYDDWDTYVTLLQEKKVKENIINRIQEIITALKTEYGENITVTYSPTEINIKNINSKIAKKVFLYMNIAKSGLTLIMYTDLSDADSVQDIHTVRHIKNQYMNVKYENEENFDLDGYMKYINKGYTLLLKED